MATQSISSDNDILYVAHTASCTFLLDSEGICRRVDVAPKTKRSHSRTAVRCIGAQYVASLDGGAAGGMVEMPRVGASMLFAKVDERGRVSLVRTATVTAFESKAAEDPFRGSATVETSAPVLPPRAEAKAAPEPARAYRAAEPTLPDEEDEDARTQRIPALRAEDIAAYYSARAREDAPAAPESTSDLATAEYQAVATRDEVSGRKTLPSRTPGPMPTLRTPPRDAVPDSDDGYAPRSYLSSSSSSSRGRSEPHLRAATARALEPEPRVAPRPQSSDVQVSRRRRG